MSRIFREVNSWSWTDVEEVVRRDDVDELVYAVIAVSLHHADYAQASSLCELLSSHRNHTIRGNALLGFGHIARRFRRVSPAARAKLELGLVDEHPYVRGQAICGMSDAEFFVSV